MRPISRRRALQLGGLGLLSATVGGVGLALSGGPWGNPVPGGPLVEPETLRSDRGLLRVELEAAESEFEIAGRRVTAFGYNGSLPGPTLRLRPGDRLQVRLVNRLRDDHRQTRGYPDQSPGDYRPSCVIVIFAARQSHGRVLTHWLRRAMSAGSL